MHGSTRCASVEAKPVLHSRVCESVQPGPSGAASHTQVAPEPLGSWEAETGARAAATLRKPAARLRREALGVFFFSNVSWLMPAGPPAAPRHPAPTEINTHLYILCSLCILFAGCGCSFLFTYLCPTTTFLNYHVCSFSTFLHNVSFHCISALKAQFQSR